RDRTNQTSLEGAGAPHAGRRLFQLRLRVAVPIDDLRAAKELPQPRLLHQLLDLRRFTRNSGRYPLEARRGDDVDILDADPDPRVPLNGRPQAFDHGAVLRRIGQIVENVGANVDAGL